MEPADIRTRTQELADDLSWLEEYAASQARRDAHRSPLRLAAAFVRNVIGPLPRWPDAVAAAHRRGRRRGGRQEHGRQSAHRRGRRREQSAGGLHAPSDRLRQERCHLAVDARLHGPAQAPGEAGVGPARRGRLPASPPRRRQAGERAAPELRHLGLSRHDDLGRRAITSPGSSRRRGWRMSSSTSPPTSATTTRCRPNSCGSSSRRARRSSSCW